MQASRFNKAFLRDKLGGRAYLTAFGKHPAWNDHLGLIGAQTESLALLEDVLYRQGIAVQVAAGSWRDANGDAKTPNFNHRFVWSRDRQSIVGVFWPSVDGKGRTQFPFICCVQTELAGAAAVQIYLDHVAKIGAQARQASGQPEVQSILERGGYDLNRWKPITPSTVPRAVRPGQEPALRENLATLAREAGHPAPGRQNTSAGSQDRSLRLRPPDTETPANLWFYASFLEQLVPAPPVYLLIASADPAAPVDCVLGEPGPDAFFCLGADLRESPVTEPPPPSALPERCRRQIDRFLAGCAAGTLPAPPRRSFWRWLTQ
jgi:hypothetical protein